ncbi:Lsr2 family protein [Zhihengliuella sp.]|uniref:histone-like nucleoid-structuring protein Lsr2 n=1 Tax=Zhihengliuella sp. TaxID=1954483 RepID=UPI0028125CCB|nr:Lsr2 family protein [Zhihengliuella sp.]
MARKVEVTLIDDLDGSKADESVKFALDGVQYEIDLSESNANELRESLKRYVEAGTRVTGGRGRNTGSSSSRSGGSKGETAAIREWAKRNGYEVSARGRIQASVVEAYRAAQ